MTNKETPSTFNTKISYNDKSKNKAKSYHTSIPKPLILKYGVEKGGTAYWDTAGDIVILRLAPPGKQPKPLHAGIKMYIKKFENDKEDGA